MTTLDEVTIREGEQFVELRRGAYAILREPEDVPERKRRPLLDAIAQADTVRAELANVADLVGGRNLADIGDTEIPIPSQETVNLIGTMTDILILALVREWSYGDVTKDVLLDVPGADYDTLRDLTAPLWAQVVPNMGVSGAVTDQDGTLVMDSAAPTQPSNA